MKTREGKGSIKPRYGEGMARRSKRKVKVKGRGIGEVERGRCERRKKVIWIATNGSVRKEGLRVERTCWR